MSRAQFEQLVEEKRRELRREVDESRSELLGDLILDVVEEWVAADQRALEASHAL